MTEIRKLIRGARIATLATLDAETGAPYASLIATATDPSGAPVTLVSGLAVHTRNLNVDPHASILFARAGVDGADPLDAPRVSLTGTAEPADDAHIRERFLARHPAAAQYADFADFAFVRLRPEKAHFVGGFGRIASIGADAFLLGEGDARLWKTEAAAVIEDVNARMAGLLRRLAGAEGRDAESFRMAACDPEGCDLLIGESGGRLRALRLDFSGSLSSPSGVPGALGALETNVTN